MTQTDRVLSNIGAIYTLIENFPMGLFETDSKDYKSTFDFLMDLLMACGVNIEELVTYIIGEMYGFDGQPGYTINGLYERIRRGDIKVNMQNPFMSSLEDAIKVILMGLFTSIYTCSALPIFPNKVFDYNSRPSLMDYNVEVITKRNDNNDRNFKLKIPVSAIDMLGMFSISPSTSQGSLYYLTDGKDAYYKKVFNTEKHTVTQSQIVEAGQTYNTKISKYEAEYEIRFEYEYFGMMTFSSFKRDIRIGSEPVMGGPPEEVKISVTYLLRDEDLVTLTQSIGMVDGTSIDTVYFSIPSSYGNDHSDTFIKTRIVDINLNGYSPGCELGNNPQEMSWCYLATNNLQSHYWEVGGMNVDDPQKGGVKLNGNFFGHSRSGETITVEEVAHFTDTYNCEVEVSSSYLTYKTIENPTKRDISRAIRYTYVPEYPYDDSPDRIVCFQGDNPNFMYRSNDMNAFLWYCYNRCNFTNQIEQNHLMWDSRLSAAKEGVERDGGFEWNTWYSSKAGEGDEFLYNGNDSSDIIYPIIQVEKYSEDEILIRIPSQRYFLPKKRKELIDGTYEPGKHYFNASIYKFDWEYLKNIQILNPKLLLVRLIENLIGLTMDVASSVKFDIHKKRIEAVLAKAVKSIITANDMGVEDCWKSFSNEDYNDLLEEMMLDRYTATKTNGESSKIKVQDISDYVNQLGQINSNVTSQGTKSMITKTVTNVMVKDGSEASTEYSYDFGFDSDMLSKLIWAVVMPIVESLLTPQVLLLMMINFQLLGIVDYDDISFGINGELILKLLVSKILVLIKSIVLYVKDKIVLLILELFKKIIKPVLTNMMYMLYLEMITDWLIILLEAVKCIPFMLGITVVKDGSLDEVDYADIVNTQSIPEDSSEC